MTNMDLNSKLLLSVFLLMLSSFAIALELDATVRSETEYSDNIRLRASDASSDTLHRLVLETAFTERRKAFQADANFTVVKDDYFQDSYDDETSLVAGLGLFNFDLVDSFLNWHSSYSRSQVIVDSALDDTPDNRDVRTVFDTGPALNYAINDATQISLSASYLNVENSNPDVSDSERYITTAGYRYRINSITEITVSAERGDTIDPDEGEEYVNKTYSVGLLRGFPHGELHLEYGRTFYLPVESIEVKGNFFQISLNREKVFFHDLEMAYSERISNSAIGLLIDIIPEDDASARVVAVSVDDVVTTKEFDAAISRSLGNYTYRLSGRWESVNYSLTETEEIHYQYAAELVQNLSPVFYLTYGYGFDIDQYPDRPDIGKNRTSSLRVDANYSVSDRLELSGGTSYEVRKNKSVPGEEHEDLRFNFTVSWEIN